MENKKSVPQLAGQWIDLVKLKAPPIQLPNRPQQQIDSYCTIWQKGEQLWAGDGFGKVNSDGLVTMYGDKAQYKNNEIVWLKHPDGLNAYVRTVDLAGVWIDENVKLHRLAQKISPVTLTETENILGRNFKGSITGHRVEVTRNNGDKLTAELSQDGFTLIWSNGSVWKRYLNLEGHWVSIVDISYQKVIEVDNDNVLIAGISGTIDYRIWYINADNTPFPTSDPNKNKGGTGKEGAAKGGIDFDSTAIHWSNYIGWQRVFDMNGEWIDSTGQIHAVTDHHITDPQEQRRFTWGFLLNGAGNAEIFTSGKMIRNWIELHTDTGEAQCGIVNYNSNRIDWENDDIWRKQS